MLKNTEHHYGAIAKIFHWVIGLAIIALLAVGIWMEGLDVQEAPYKFEVYGLHKSFGIVVLVLLVGRLCWRVYSQSVKAHDNHQAWERHLAKFAHIMLYVTAFAMPLTGWAMSSAGGHGVSLFGLDLPDIVPENRELGRFFNQTHGIIGYAMIALIGLHVAGALKHHFIDKDTTLKRMLPGFKEKK